MSNTDTNNIKELTLKEIFIQVSQWLRYIASKWFYLLAAILIGIFIGFFYSKFSPTKYIADTNFVIEGKGSGSEGLGSVIGLGSSESAGLFNSSNNIIWLYSSEDLISKTFLTPILEGKYKDELLINVFTKTSLKLHDALKKMSKEYHNLFFDNNDTIGELSPLKIKYLRVCANIFKSDNLKVSKVEKTENIINVNVTSDDEDFSYYFNTELIKRVNDFYIYSKTKKQKETVEALQLKVDTLKTAVDKNMYEVAQTADLNPFPNPHLKVLNVEPQKQNIDVQVLSSLYIQATQSLELAKNELSKLTPIIQTIDEPILPLKTSKLGKAKAMTLGGILGFFLPFLYFIPRKVYLDAMKK